MIKDRIQFKNANPLYIEENLLSLLHNLGFDTELNDAMRRWSARGIGDVFVFTPEHLEPGLSVALSLFLDICKKEGFSVTLVRLTDILENRFEYYRNTNSIVLNRLKAASCLLLFPGHIDAKILSYIATIPITPRHSRILPEEAIRYISGRIGIEGGEDRRVHQFKKYIDQTYTPPKDGGNGHKSAALEAPPEIPSPVTESEDKSQKTVAQKETIAEAKTESREIAAPKENETVRPEEKSQAMIPAVPAEVTPLPVETKAVEKKPAKKAPAIQTAKTLPDDFQPSKFTIRVKLLSIISLTIFGALSVMIFLASYFFRNNLEVQIQEANLKQVRILASRLQTELESISFRAHLTATNLEEEIKSDEKKRQFADLFFQNNANFIFIGTAENRGGRIIMRQSMINEKYLNDSGLKQADIVKLTDANQEYLAKAFNGANVLQNVSPGYSSPILVSSMPLGEPSPYIIIVFMDMSKFLEIFKSSDIYQTFMVNDRSDVIAHGDQKLVMSRTNLTQVPVVAAMWKGGSPNGHIPYEFEGQSYFGGYQKLDFAGVGILSTVQKDKAFEAVYRIQRSNLFIMAIILTLAILVIYFFSKTLTVPIVNLVGGTREVEQGNYGIDLKPTTRDEVGILTSSFVRMARGLEEREKMKDALGKFVNPEIAERVLRGEIALGGERKQCAIFFSDLRNFTAMSEKMQPEEVVEYLNQYFTAMVNCVNVTKGIVDKFIGDAIMAHWGAIVSHGNDTENAVNAGLMMRMALVEFNKWAVEKNRPKAFFGCGINSGPVLAGQIGSEDRLDYTVIGDAVNLASRIESLNKPFGTDVLISTDSYELVKDIFNVAQMPAIKVKGKSEPQLIYAVLGRKDDPNCPKTVEEVRAIAGIEFEDHASHGDGEEEKEVKYEIIEK